MNRYASKDIAVLIEKMRCKEVPRLVNLLQFPG